MKFHHKLIIKPTNPETYDNTLLVARTIFYNAMTLLGYQVLSSKQHDEGWEYEFRCAADSTAEVHELAMGLVNKVVLDVLFSHLKGAPLNLVTFVSEPQKVYA
jgi:hypothetical protein